ncbi:CBS domain-containing protein CBSX5-like [Malania oleifera]|uniref:CBS domain-containing protein CBSX5-like n=1 Tax=Malania oleifera TaxID=397392 RepID=UPI0025AE0863|nr:CBS domain-containing protein CBSX5-like [Malania oleifera]
MAVSLLAHEVSDLCLGKPALRSLPLAATVADALSALKLSDDNYVSVWSCDHSSSAPTNDEEDCRCVGKICMVDMICYLCREENLCSPAAALKAPVSVILPKIPKLVVHVEPYSSLLDAIDLILQGAQNLVVPIQRNPIGNSRRKLLQKSQVAGPTFHNGREFCWLTQEDVIRFLLSSIGLFSPLPALSIHALGIISCDVLSVNYHSPASSAIHLISRSLAEQTSVAVTDDDGYLVGEISPFTLACCDETVSCAVATLSAGDLMAYIDCGGPPEDIVRAVKRRLKEMNLEGMLEEFAISSLPISSFSSSSSDEESSPLPSPRPAASMPRSGRYGRSGSYSARMVRRAEAIVCHPGSSLVAVMVQAIAHRVNYVWVVEDECSLAGIVTFSDMLKVFREHLAAME